MDADAYAGQEQTFAKHRTLECYLEKLAFKIGGFRDRLTLNYVDGFAGPWNSKREDLGDTSPVIAIEQLRKARDALAKRRITLYVRGFFVSKEPEQKEQLAAALARYPDVETVVATGEFEANIERAREFVRKGDPFGFIFIDPTGWTGFALERIVPLLTAVRSSEVLLNFMLGHIARFVDTDSPNVLPGFADLFGDEQARQAWRGLVGREREDKIVETYCAKLGSRAGYKHCVSSVVLNPVKDRTHFHLVYGTKSDHGLIAFRESERAALDAYLAERTVARAGPQLALFAPRAIGPTVFEAELQKRYLDQAIKRVEATLTRKGRESWPALLCEALHVPMVCERDMTSWLDEERQAGRLIVEGLAPKQRVPKLTDKAVFVLRR